MSKITKNTSILGSLIIDYQVVTYLTIINMLCEVLGGHLAHRPTGGSGQYSWVKCLPKVIFLGKIFVRNDIFEFDTIMILQENLIQL